MGLALLLAAGAYALQRDDDPVPVEPPGVVTEVTGAEVFRFTIASEAVGEELATSVVVPEGAREGPQPLLVFLHGLGGSDLSFTANPALLEAPPRSGGEPRSSPSPTGGPASGTTGPAATGVPTWCVR